MTFSVVASVAPGDFDRRIGPEPPEHFGGPAVRENFAETLTNTLFLGTAIGVLLAAFLGIILARQLLRPLETVSAAAGAMARGDYGYREHLGGYQRLVVYLQLRRAMV